MAGAEWKEAENSAWAAWRRAMSDKAAQACDATLANRRVAPRVVPRVMDKIKCVKRGIGLVLESGRTINWHVTAIKIRNHELDFSGDIKPRLLVKL